MLALFVAVLVVRSLLMVARDGRSPFTLGKGKRGAARAVEVFMPVGFALWFVALLVSTTGNPGDLPGVLGTVIIDAEWARLLGSALLAASVGLFVWALASFGSSWRVGIDETAPGALVTGGVFAYSRNPIFVSMDAFFLGTFLIQGTAFFLFAFALTALLTHLQILQEEAFLAREYGRDYADYRARAPRYIGWTQRASQGGDRAEGATP
jgi:protein-S-isoprenylcysteine O-methyltransferase Ste14